jgi:D-alanyl-D-alanine carboxypeptidase
VNEKKIFNLISYVFIFACVISLLTIENAEAKVKKNIKASPALRHAALVMDYSSGNILFQEHANKPRYPASLTKMMTLYLTFDAIKKGLINQNDSIKVSTHAASRPKMNLGLIAGQKISLHDAVMATIVKSANDAAVVLAEAVAGSEENFARKMTEIAHKLGMHHSYFKNSSGLHHAEQRTTAHDMAKLAIALKRDFPEYYHLFSKTSFIYKGETHYGHNRVLKTFPGATGLKTGFINASGFNLVTSAARGNTKLIGVVMGGDTAKARDSKMTSLLNKYFATTEEVNQTSQLVVPESPSIKKTLPKKRSKIVKPKTSKELNKLKSSHFTKPTKINKKKHKAQ